MKNKIIYAVTIICSLLYIFIANKVILGDMKFFDEDEASRLYKSEVTKILTTKEDEYGEEVTIFKAKILEGDTKGEEVIATQILDSYGLINHIDVKEKDKIYLYKHEDGR